MAKKVKKHRVVFEVSRATLQKRIDAKKAELLKLTLKMEGLAPVVEVAVVAAPQAP